MATPENDRKGARLLNSRDAVLQAIGEYDRLGQEKFLSKYGFGPARTWHLLHEGRSYDSKAIVGAAVGYEHPEKGPLSSKDFTGGLHTSVAKLRELGFEVRGDGGEEPDGYFILNQKAGESGYDDVEGERYSWTSKSSGSGKKLAELGHARFIYYRPGQADDGTSKSYFGHGWISRVESTPGEQGVTDFVGTIRDYEPFARPVAFQDGPSRNAQTSIQPISREVFERLLQQGVGASREPRKRRVVVVYVGAQGQANLEHGLRTGRWGFPRSHEDYERLGPGDWILFGSGQSGGGVRVSDEEWAKHQVRRVIAAQVTTAVEEELEPFWPDEEQTGTVKYPVRLSFQTALERENVDLNPGGPLGSAGEALRGSALSSGRGHIVPASEVPMLESPPSLAASTEDILRAANAFSDGLAATGLVFEPGLARSFLAALATKRFAILTGLSGSGKTQIGLKLGQWFGDDRYLITPVRPDWTGPEMLFGFEDALQPAVEGFRPWHVPPTLEFMLKAHANPGSPHLLLLDEMNLAHVERYFADFLSGLESEEPVLPNLRCSDGRWIPRDEPAQIPIPANLFVVGTVNVDETTYMFSPKVLDRANTFEFRVTTGELSHLAEKPSDMPAGKPRDATTLLAVTADPAWHLEHTPGSSGAIADKLRELHAGLSTFGNEFGHRVYFEAVRFAAIFEAMGGTPAEAIDRQVLQKVLPRVHGARRQVEEPLAWLKSFCETAGSGLSGESGGLDERPDAGALPLSLDKVERMIRRMERSQFTSFTD